MSLTNKIKASLLEYYNFVLGSKISCTELFDGFSIADFITIKKNIVTEVEIKISVADLKNELKKGEESYNYKIENGLYEKKDTVFIPKHKILSNGTNQYFTPNKFYFCVPTNIIEETIDFANKLNPKYGVIEYLDKIYIRDCLTIRKKAKLLHSEDNYKEYLDKMIRRTRNDLTCKYRLLYWNKE